MRHLPFWPDSRTACPQLPELESNDPPTELAVELRRCAACEPDDPCLCDLLATPFLCFNAFEGNFHTEGTGIRSRGYWVPGARHYRRTFGRSRKETWRVREGDRCEGDYRPPRARAERWLMGGMPTEAVDAAAGDYRGIIAVSGAALADGESREVYSSPGPQDSPIARAVC